MSNHKDRFIVKRRVETVETPDFGTVHIRKLSGLEYIQVRGDGEEDTRSTVERTVELILLSICDESGKRLLEDDDGAIPMAWPAESFQAVMDGIIALNGLSGEMGAD